MSSTLFSIRKKIYRWILDFPFWTYKMRNNILRKMGVVIGHNSVVGKHFFLSDRSTDKGLLIIGDRVEISANVTVTTTSGPCISKLSKVIPVQTKKVVIEDDVWIGNNVVILPGVTIGKCSIVGAGTIVRKKVPPFSIVTGNPASISDLPSAYKSL